MGFGDHVRIARPPPGFEAWMDKKAEVVTLLPVAKHPLLYEVRDEDGKSLTLPADALEPFKIDREEDTEGPDGYLNVNGLVYCQKHELEVCGKCGVDYRSSNFLQEYHGEDSLDIIEDWLVDIAKTGAPPRQAPKKRGKVNRPGNPAAFRPVISDHLLLIDQDSNFDPSACDPWPQEMKTEGLMRNHAAFTKTDHSVPEFAKLPVRRVRETIVVLARRWHEFLSQKSRNEPMARILLQDEAQTQVLSLDLLLPIRVMTIGSVIVPIFAVRWAHNKASNMQKAIQVAQTMERNTKMNEVTVEVDEIQFLAEFLETNTKRMDPCFLRKEGRQYLSVSVLTSISNNMQNAHYKSISPYCHQCGTSGCDTMKCARCQKARYCSRTCQRKNWKYHKLSCCK